MKPTFSNVFVGFVFVAAIVAGMRFLPWASSDATVQTSQASVNQPQPVVTPAPALAAEVEPAVFADPISMARLRVTKKPFGLEITPETSPVENDRFSGYHVGVDFETFDTEKDSDVDIFAVCNGPLIWKGFAKGYGGVAEQSCELEGKTVSIIYGHVKADSIVANIGDQISAGQKIAILGKGHSPETDGVRKHLHLGIHEGPANDLRGYVKDPVEMEQWRDVLNYISL